MQVLLMFTLYMVTRARWVDFSILVTAGFIAFAHTTDITRQPVPVPTNRNVVQYHLVH